MLAAIWPVDANLVRVLWHRDDIHVADEQCRLEVRYSSWPGDQITQVAFANLLGEHNITDALKQHAMIAEQFHVHTVSRT